MKKICEIVDDAYPRLENSLFDAVKLVKNGDLISTNVLDIECFQ